MAQTQDGEVYYEDSQDQYPLHQVPRPASTATINASASASSEIGALSDAWAALLSTMLKQKHASALMWMCRSLISVEDERLGIRCHLMQHQYRRGCFTAGSSPRE